MNQIEYENEFTYINMPSFSMSRFIRICIDISNYFGVCLKIYCYRYLINIICIDIRVDIRAFGCFQRVP